MTLERCLSSSCRQNCLPVRGTGGTENAKMVAVYISYINNTLAIHPTSPPQLLNVS